jgi:hypothetical protein
LGKLTDDAAQGQKAVIASYNKILDELVDLLKKEDVSHEERVQILERMLYVADRIAEHDKEQKRFLKEIAAIGAAAIGGAFVLGAAILGVLYKKDS